MSQQSQSTSTSDGSQSSEAGRSPEIVTGQALFQGQGSHPFYFNCNDAFHGGDPCSTSSIGASCRFPEKDSSLPASPARDCGFSVPSFTFLSGSQAVSGIARHEEAPFSIKPEFPIPSYTQFDVRSEFPAVFDAGCCGYRTTDCKLMDSDTFAVYPDPSTMLRPFSFIPKSGQASCPNHQLVPYSAGVSDVAGFRVFSSLESPNMESHCHNSLPGTAPSHACVMSSQSEAASCFNRVTSSGVFSVSGPEGSRYPVLDCPFVHAPSSATGLISGSFSCANPYSQMSASNGHFFLPFASSSLNPLSCCQNPSASFTTRSPDDLAALCSHFFTPPPATLPLQPHSDSQFFVCPTLVAQAPETLTDSSLLEETKKSPKRASKTLPPCRICGESASGFHYGVNSCEACKGFYRRTLKSHRPHKCRGGKGQCIIKGGNPRKLCGFCRYKRCLSLGMSQKAIKPGRYTHTKRTQDTLEVLQLKDQSGSSMLSDREVDRIVEQLVTFDRYVSSTGHVRDEVLSEKSRMVFEHQRLRTQGQKPATDALADDLYLEIYRQAGIDVDNRRHLIDIFAMAIEKYVRGFMKFATGIPGFRDLPVKDQIKLLRHGQEEFWLIGSYRGFDHERRTFVSHNGTSWLEKDYAHWMGDEISRFEFDMSQKLRSAGISHEELVVLKTMCLMSSDRCTLEEPRKVEELQLKLMYCLRTLLKRNHPHNHQKIMTKVMTCVVELRDMAELARECSDRRPLLKEVLDHHPALKDLVTCKCQS